MVTLLYTRQNLMEEGIADLFDVAQSTVSEIVTKFTRSSPGPPRNSGQTPRKRSR
jgi:predicted XRE-type DNA-binding protein